MYPKNMINKIDKERRHSMNVAPIRPRRTPKKNRTGHKAEQGQAKSHLYLNMHICDLEDFSR
jgi:hypothetical protein